MYDVIIPALNEEATIGHIVETFKSHPSIGNVNVMIDDNTEDNTDLVVLKAGGSPWRLLGVTGKGQLVQWGLVLVDTQCVILADADYTQFAGVCIDRVISPHQPQTDMRIVVPNPPTHQEWCESGLQNRNGFTIPFSMDAWALNSGFRSFPVAMAENTEFHGYLLETHLNRLAHKKGVKINLITCKTNMVAPLRFTERRLQAMEDDRQWGLDHGIFAPWSADGEIY